GNADTLNGRGWNGPMFRTENDTDIQLDQAQYVSFLPDGGGSNFIVTQAGTYTVSLNIITLAVTFHLDAD
ncbi:MAG: hypothetical protein FWF29_01375, partial [Treponema sp.]|nr:hypothetical protein [Treponema sp.]